MLYNISERNGGKMITEEWKMDAKRLPGNPALPQNTPALLLNIETTGLYARSSFVYMAGAAWPQDGSFQVRILLAHSRRDEPLLLDELHKLLLRHPAVYTYGGRSFSYQYLNERYANYHEGILIAGNQMGNDLQKRTAPYREVIGLPDMKKLTAEAAAGFQRSGIREGARLIEVYEAWERSHEEADSETLLTHCREDMYSLAWLLPLASFSDFFSGKAGKPQIDDEGSCLRLDFASEIAFPWDVSWTGAYADIALHAHEAGVRLPVREGRLRYFLSGPCRDYYYLPEEDQAVHKSVAAFVDRNYRRRATPDTLYVPQDGRFVQLPPEILDGYRVFRESRKDRRGYIRTEDMDAQLAVKMLPYIAKKA